MQRSSTPEVSDLIGERLRAYYHALEEQGTPKLLLDLLRKLEAADDLKRRGKSKRDVF
jgi:Anti-sigma factor NepR